MLQWLRDGEQLLHQGPTRACGFAACIKRTAFGHVTSESLGMGHCCCCCCCRRTAITIICNISTILHALHVLCRESFWCCCQPGIGPKTSGYSGVATFVKAHTLPVRVELGLTGVLGPAAELSGVSLWVPVVHVVMLFQATYFSLQLQLL